MKRIAVCIGLVCTLATPANAQNFQCANHWNINAIQQSLENRIRTGSKNGSLTPAEVSRLQTQFNRINDLEGRLRKGGLNSAERDRLDNQLDDLSAEIYRDSHNGTFLGPRPWGWIHTPAHRPRGWDDRRWNSVRWDDRKWDGRYNINRREDELSARVKHGERDGSLSHEEARELRHESRSIEKAEERRRADGNLSANDRRALDRRMDNMSREIHQERHDQGRHDEGRHGHGHHHD